MKIRPRVCAFALLGAATFLTAALGQEHQRTVEFEAASVKLATPPAGNTVMRRMANPDPAMLDYSNVTLKMLIAAAYEVKEFQISGPDWLESGGYDVRARIPAGTSKDRIPSMLRALLADRFKLALHRETRNLPVYALVIAKGGPKLKEVDPETLNRQAAGAGGSPDAPPPPSPDGAEHAGTPPSGPGLRVVINHTGARQMFGQAETSRLANLLSSFLERPVLDKTGLKGTYEMNMVWAADEREGGAMQRMLAGAPPGHAGEDARPADSASAPAATIFAAIQNDLGLRLEPRKSDIEFLVIDRVEKIPTEN